MYIERDEVRMAHRILGAHLSMQLDDSVMIKPEGRLDLKDLHFIKGPQEWQEFLQTERDPYAYEQFDTRSLYEILIAIDKGKIPGRDLVIDGIRHGNLIDLDSMLEDRVLIYGLQFMATKIQWGVNDNKTDGERKVTENLLEQFKVDLVKLCKDDYGVGIAGQIWAEYGARLPIEKPDLTVSRQHQWFLDSSPRPVGNTTPLIGRTTGTNMIGASEWEMLKTTMIKLGSQLDFNEVEQNRICVGDVLGETQKFGKLGKPDFLDVTWHIGNGVLNQYEAVLRRHIDIPDWTVGGINLKRLEAKMATVDWTTNWFLAWGSDERLNLKDKALVDSIFRDFDKMEKDKILGEVARRQLGLKYIAYSVNSYMLDGVERLKDAYEKRVLMKADDLRMGALELYNLLDGRSVLKNVGKNESDWKWFSLDKNRRMEDGGRVVSLVQNTAQFNLLSELTVLGVHRPHREVMESLAAGSKVQLTVEIANSKAPRIFYADPHQSRLVVDKEVGEYYGLYRVPDAELYSSRISQANQYLPQLLQRAEAIGIAEPNLRKIEEEAITRGRSFSISEDKRYGDDLVRFSIEMGKVGGSAYSTTAIRADLRPGLPPSDPTVNGIYIFGLTARMQRIDWSQDFFYPASQDFHNNHPAGDRKMLDSVNTVSADLNALFYGIEGQGKDIAAVLALRFLKDTTNELMLPPELLLAMKNKEKTIIFPGKPEFSLESLYHLMNERFAMGQRYDILGSPVERGWYQFNRDSLTERGVPSIMLVPSNFSAEDVLRRHGLVESKVPAMVNTLAAELEKGAVVTVHADSPKATLPIQIYADPKAKTLMVDLKKTLAGKPLISKDQLDRLPALPLKEFYQAVQKATTNKAIPLHVLEIVAKKTRDDKGDEPSQNKSRKQ